jgi:hypothetical protein
VAHVPPHVGAHAGHRATELVPAAGGIRQHLDPRLLAGRLYLYVLSRRESSGVVVSGGWMTIDCGQFSLPLGRVHCLPHREA